MITNDHDDTTDISDAVETRCSSEILDLFSHHYIVIAYNIMFIIAYNVCSPIDIVSL